LTTGGPLIVTLEMVPVMLVAVLILSADPEVVVPGGPVAPAGPAGPAEPVVPLHPASSALANRMQTAPRRAHDASDCRFPVTRDIWQFSRSIE
jgi:hypothetical protein